MTDCDSKIPKSAPLTLAAFCPLMAKFLLACFLVMTACKSEPTGAREPEVTFRHSVAGGKLMIEYSVVNRSDETIFVFDRMWDRDNNRLDADWAYVAVSSKTAVLKRDRRVPGRAPSCVVRSV